MLTFLFRRGLYILLLGAAVFSGLLPVMYIFKRDIYKSEGLILIDPNRKGIIETVRGGNILGDLRDTVDTEAILLLSPSSLLPSLADLEPDEYPGGLLPTDTDEHKVSVLKRMLKATRIEGGILLSVEMESLNPVGIAEYVNSLMKNFLKRKENHQLNASANRLDFLKEEYRKTTKRLRSKEAELEMLAKNVKTASFGLDFDVASVNVLDIQKELMRVYFEMLEARSMLSRALDEEKALIDLDQHALSSERTKDNLGYYSIESFTYAELQRLRQTIDGLTKDNPERRAVEERMKAMSDYLDSYRNNLYTEWYQINADKNAHELGVNKIKAKLSFNQAKDHYDRLKNEYERALEDSFNASQFLSRSTDIKTAIDQLRDRQDRLEKAIDDITLESKAPTNITIEQLATAPTEPSSNNLKILAFLSFVFSFGPVGVFLFLRDFLDNVIRQPKEVEYAIGGMPSRPIPLYPDAHNKGASAVCDFPLVAVSDPGTAAATAIRSLAVKLNNERDKNRSKLFVFSGINRKAGTSSVLLNTASALTAFCPKVLVIDLSMSEEKIDIFKRDETNKGGEKGEGTEDALANMFVYDEQRGVSVLASGILEAKEVYRKGFLRLIEKARETFDMILIDSDPLNESDITQYILYHSEALVLVAQENVSRYSDLYQAVNLAHLSNIPAITAILNKHVRKPFQNLQIGAI